MSTLQCVPVRVDKMAAAAAESNVGSTKHERAAGHPQTAAEVPERYLRGVGFSLRVMGSKSRDRHSNPEEQN